MIKERVISIAVLFLILFSIGFVSSVGSGIAPLDSALNSADKTINTVQGNATSFIIAPPKTKDQLKSEYISNALFGQNGLLERNVFFGPIFISYKKVAVYTDPVVRYIVGADPALTWFFILAFILWCVLLKYYYTLYLVFRDFSLLSVNTVKIISGLVFVALTVLQVFQIISVFLIDQTFALIAVFSAGWMQLAGFVVLIVALIFLGIFSKKLQAIARLIERKIKAAKKAQQEKEREERLDHVIRREEKIADSE